MAAGCRLPIEILLFYKQCSIQNERWLSTSALQCQINSLFNVIFGVTYWTHFIKYCSVAVMPLYMALLNDWYSLAPKYISMLVRGGLHLIIILWAIHFEKRITTKRLIDKSNTAIQNGGEEAGECEGDDGAEEEREGCKAANHNVSHHSVSHRGKLCPCFIATW